MKRMLGLALVAGGVALAVMVGQRMSTEAMAVAMGVVFGVAASIPTSLLVVAATRERRRELPGSGGREAGRVSTQPQIYIVSGRAPAVGQGSVGPWQREGMTPPWPLPPGGTSGYQAVMPERRFRVVGEDDQWLEAEPDQRW